jgi:hypothetical protein
MLFKKYIGEFGLLASSALIAACSNFAETQDSAVTFSSAVKGDTLWVGIQDSTYEIDIATDGDWKIVNETDFASVNEESGTGNAKIELDVLYNDYDLSRYGKVQLRLPDGERNIVLAQHGRADLDENDASTLESTNKTFVVGYSYDAIKGGYASKDAVKKEIFDTKKLIDSAIIDMSEPHINYSEKSFTGRTVAEVGYKMAQSMGVNGKQDNFQGEIENSLNLKVSADNTYEFALTYINVGILDISSNMPFEELKDGYMIPYVKKDINGLSSAFSSKNKNWKRDLVREYGSHVAMASTLGGRIRFAMSANTANIQGDMDINQMSKATLKSGDANATDSTSQKLVASLKQNLAAANLEIHVEGGRESKAKIAADNNLPDTKAIQDWKMELLGYRLVDKLDGYKKVRNCESVYQFFGRACTIRQEPIYVKELVQELHYDEVSLVDFPKGALVPLYELIDRSLTQEHDGVDGEARYRELRAYFEGDEIVSDFRSKFDNGAAAEIALPEYEESDTATLIQDVFLGGQRVAQVAQEFIPELDTKNRVTVVYPVHNNKMNMKMGYFIGRDTHRPARISWNGSDVSVTEDPEFGVGEPRKIYIRGTVATPVPPKGATVYSGRVEGAYLNAKKATGYKSAAGGKSDYTIETDYKYSLVKIFDKIWLRENYMTTYDNTGKAYNTNQWRWSYKTGNFKKTGNVVFLKKEVATNANFAPAGWRVASSSDFEQINKKFDAKSLGSSVAGLKAGGVVGFNGDYDYRHNIEGAPEQETSFNLSDGYYATIADGASVVRTQKHSGKSNDIWRNVRLIMK